MSPGARFAKTEKGRGEIRDRKHGLTPRARQLLVMVDGSRTVDELLRLGAAPEALASLIKDGFIREVVAEARLAPELPDAGPLPPDVYDKLRAAKAVLNSYAKMAAVEASTMSALIDWVQTPQQLASALRKTGRIFKAHGLDEAFANLQKEIGELSSR